MYTVFLFYIFTIDVKIDNSTSIVDYVAVSLRINQRREMVLALHCLKDINLLLCLRIFLTQNPRKWSGIQPFYVSFIFNYINYLYNHWIRDDPKPEEPRSVPIATNVVYKPEMAKVMIDLWYVSVICMEDVPVIRPSLPILE